MNTRYLAKHCWGCGDPTHDERGILSESRRVWILMLDGHPITLTIHEQCIDDLDMNGLWKLLREGEVHDHKINGGPAAAYKLQMQLLCPPLGILFVE